MNRPGSKIKKTPGSVIAHDNSSAIAPNQPLMGRITPQNMSEKKDGERDLVYIRETEVLPNEKVNKILQFKDEED